MTFSFRGFDRAMSIAVGADRLAVAGKEQIWSLRDHSGLAPAIAPAGRYDRCWLPRTSTVTGGIQCHEVAWGTTGSGEPDLWIVNTLFFCLAGPDPSYSFVPRWRPLFISRLAAQDRCHLNGLAMRDGFPAFVTVMAFMDEPGGWRRVRNNSGAVLGVGSGGAVTMGVGHAALAALAQRAPVRPQLRARAVGEGLPGLATNEFRADDGTLAVMAETLAGTRPWNPPSPSRPRGRAGRSGRRDTGPRTRSHGSLPSDLAKASPSY